MIPLRAVLLASAAALAALPALAKAPDKPAVPAATPQAADAPRPTHLMPFSDTGEGSVTVGGQKIDYTSVVGTLVVHPRGFDDVAEDHPADAGAGEKPPLVAASMSYVAYFKKGAEPGSRPVTFFYNGGPGSSTVWLHMGAFGPKRVVTADDTHTPAAPYTLVNNDFSLLDVTDLVFVDMPGTGFGRLEGPEDIKGKAFWGIDQDAFAFASFIQQFLGTYGRWNSPKYLFGESYGTTRSAVLSALLEGTFSIDLNGVILLSQILDFGNSPDGADADPGHDMPYVLSLPSYAAIAWYHHKLPPEANPPADASGLPALLQKVEAFATDKYMDALAQGAALPDAQRDAIAEQLHLYTGLPVAYLKKADLRVDGGEFEKTLLDDSNETTGRLDARFSGPTMDPLSKEADYDPQSAAISSAYVSSFNDYVRRDLHYAGSMQYRPEIFGETHWDFQHVPPGGDYPERGTPNVMPDLAAAMKMNPLLKVQLESGYYDLATPFYEGVYELQHLPMPQKLQANISIAQYASGHMVYAHTPALQDLHANVAKFITSTDNVQPAAAHR